MPACRILDLAQVLSDHYKRPLEYDVIGIRAGEKLHEELVSEYESVKTVEDDNFRIILPMTNTLDSQYAPYSKMKEIKYTSNDHLMNTSEIKTMLQD
jgi:UDP-N-acetylglucosamine 4,6-dehydratase/5-epimerase